MRNPLLKTPESGFTLIEVLVALVVLSMGLLGVAAMQITSLRTNTSAAQRSQATYLAYDIADRMRANRDAALDNAYNNSFADDGKGSANPIAKADLVEWKARIAETFPKSMNGASASGQITREGATDRFTISIQWNDTRGVGDALVFTTRTQI